MLPNGSREDEIVRRRTDEKATRRAQHKAGSGTLDSPGDRRCRHQSRTPPSQCGGRCSRPKLTWNFLLSLRRSSLTLRARLRPSSRSKTSSETRYSAADNKRWETQSRMKAQVSLFSWPKFASFWVWSYTYKAYVACGWKGVWYAWTTITTRWYTSAGTVLSSFSFG